MGLPNQAAVDSMKPHIRKTGTKKAMEAHVYNFQIRVLLYQEDNEFVAHALEMDLMGYGKTQKEALRGLQGLLEAQITFARQQDDDRLIDCPAPKEFFERWEKAHLAALKKQVFPDKPIRITAKAILISLEKPLKQLGRKQTMQFRQLTTATVCA
jgi:hypothetical protein